MCLIWLYSSSFFLRLRLIESCKYIYIYIKIRIYMKERMNDLQKFPFLNVTDEHPHYEYSLNSAFPLSLWSGSFRCISPLSTGQLVHSDTRKNISKYLKVKAVQIWSQQSISVLCTANDKFWTTMWLKEAWRIYRYKSMYVHIHAYVHIGPDPALTDFGGTKHGPTHLKLKCSACLITPAEPS